MSFTALKVAGVNPAKTDADQVRILRPLWVVSGRYVTAKIGRKQTSAPAVLGYDLYPERKRLRETNRIVND